MWHAPSVLALTVLLLPFALPTSGSHDAGLVVLRASSVGTAKARSPLHSSVQGEGSDAAATRHLLLCSHVSRGELAVSTIDASLDEEEEAAKGNDNATEGGKDVRRMEVGGGGEQGRLDIEAMAMARPHRKRKHRSLGRRELREVRPVGRPVGYRGLESWRRCLEQLLFHRMHHGRCLLLSELKEVEMVQWMQRQRMACKAGALDQDRQDRLQRAGFVWDQRQADWQGMFEELLRFKDRFGHCNVPHKSAKHRILGTWVFNQRVRNKAGKLSKEKRRRLQEAGLVWGGLKKARSEREWQLRYKDSEWEVRFAWLLQFRMARGHCKVEKSQGAMGRWVSLVRSLGKSGRLQKERMAQMVGIDFDWGHTHTHTHKRRAEPRVSRAWSGDGHEVTFSTF